MVLSAVLGMVVITIEAVVDVLKAGASTVRPIKHEEVVNRV